MIQNTAAESPKEWIKMSTVGDRETGTQARVLTCFQKVLGYTYLGNWQTRQGNSNIEKELLTDWLKSSGHDDTIITKVLFELEKAAALGGSRKLYEANREVYELLFFNLLAEKRWQIFVALNTYALGISDIR